MRVHSVVRRSLAVCLSLLAGIAVSSCSGGGGTSSPQCEDGIDNDGDLLIDELDPSCVAGNDRESDDPVKLCVDGLDNDGDGLIDSADPGCTGATDDDEFNGGPAQCSDGIDNDGDAKTDYPSDPGCLNANQNSELDNCPTGTGCPQCGDGVDNDGDTRVDYPNDPGCTSGSDDDEFVLDTTACGVGTAVGFLPDNGMATGTIGTGVSNLISQTCQGRGQEVAYVLRIDHAVTMVATTDLPGTAANTVLYIRRSCRDGATELACNDDVSPTDTKSILTADLTPGIYFLIVDGRDLASSGAFALSVRFYAGQGEACVDMNGCAPGYVCRAVAPATQTTCEHPVCSDGRDDDGDTKIDFPNDPGCTDANDSDETDTCPGVGCPQCGDGVDNDSDGFIDFPTDIGCLSANGATEIDCSSETDPLIIVNTPLFTGGTTVGAVNNQHAACGTTGTQTAPDRVHYLTLSVPVANLNVTITPSFDSTISFTNATCSTSFDCQDGNTLTRTNVAPGGYGIVVDGWSSGSGTYTLAVHGDLAVGAACNDPLVAAGVLSCSAGYACRGAAGAETCQLAACNDAIDQDGDTFNGYPTDPGCTSTSDNDETDNCPSGPGCPACSDDLDNDGDGQIDYPLDIGCGSAAGSTELGCAAETDPLLIINAPNFSGTTVGATNDLRATCGTTGTATAPERVHALTLRIPVATLTATVNAAFDAAVSLTDATCTVTDQCIDPNPAVFTRTNVAPGGYSIIVDGWGSGSGTYTLNVVGTLTAGGACNDPLVAAGVLSCPSGFACAGAVGAETCVAAACNDTIDQDGDTFNGYPTDPGCASPSDNDETDNCPAGPGCPVCSDDIDNDSDGQIDYPLDIGCASAAGATELSCSTETDPLIIVNTPSFSGTTVGAANDLRATCGTTGTQTAPDRVHYLTLQVPVTNLTITIINAFDSAISLTDSTCGTTLQCSDPNTLTRPNVPAGSYGIIVDGWSAGSGAYTLNIHGDIAAAASCRDPLVAAGVLSCGAGFVCGGTVGAETCIPAACNDAIDQDGDTFNGFPTDPGCTSTSDNDETDNCPSGAGCPVCSDDIDNDSDGQIDYPLDVSCASASGTSEASCGPETDPLGTIAGPVTNSTTVGTTNNFTPSCQSFTLGDRVFLMTLAVPVATLTMDTEGSVLTDTVLMFMNGACGLPPIACDDDGGTGFYSLITRTAVAAGTYAIEVDTYDSQAPNAFTLNVHGTIASGSSCADPLVAAGVLTCAAGTTCQAGLCSP
jgi:large repetitive protein